MHLLRRDCGPGDPRKPSLEKIISAGWVLSLFKEMGMMRFSREPCCHIQELLVNLKCPSYFSAKVKLCRQENKERVGMQEGRDIEKKPRRAAFSGEKITYWNLSFRRFFRQAFFFPSLMLGPAPE
jgi:hypothetical protein